MKKHIYIYSPSSAIGDKAVIRRGAARLKALGYEVELDEAVFARHMRFAGDDETRLAAIHRAAASGADVALITRGGYGLTRLLPAIRYKAVAKAIDRGMQFVGLSDFTAFQSAVLAETGAITWAGPAVGEDFGVEGEPDDIMQACFEDLVNGQGEGTGWQLPRPEAPAAPLSLSGKLWGGNLSVLAALAGSRWLPKVKGGDPVPGGRARTSIPRRADADAAAAMPACWSGRKPSCSGHFTNYKPVPHDRGLRLQTVWSGCGARSRRRC